MHPNGAVLMLVEHGCEALLWIQHEIKIGANSLRAVKNKTEGIFLIRPSAHIGAKEGSRVAPLLLVPRAAIANEISLLDPQAVSSLQVFPQRRVSLLDNV